MARARLANDASDHDALFALTLASGLRADYIKDRLESEQASLRGRLVASGKGSREMIVGTGRDDASDSLDRRVELKVIPCGAAAGAGST